MPIFKKTLRTDRIILAGCSRLGSSLADMLSVQNKHVVIIDSDAQAFRKLPSSYSGMTMEGDGSDVDVLREAGAARADLLAATTDNDDINIMIALIAKQIFHIPRVVVRLLDTSKKACFTGVDVELICPAELSMNAFRHIIGDDASGMENVQ